MWKLFVTHCDVLWYVGCGGDDEVIVCPGCLCGWIVRSCLSIVVGMHDYNNKQMKFSFGIPMDQVSLNLAIERTSHCICIYTHRNH